MNLVLKSSVWWYNLNYFSTITRFYPQDDEEHEVEGAEELDGNTQTSAERFMGPNDYGSGLIITPELHRSYVPPHRSYYVPFHHS